MGKVLPEFILYVADQARAREFYATVLAQEPVLDVPGMTEFDLGGALLGLMPATDIAALLGGAVQPGERQRCEVYLRRPDAAEALARAATAGGRVVSGLAPRPWGETAGYALDLDGHVLAVALPGS
jgi:predicted enzyme related to lactoylglutathione lyase